MARVKLTEEERKERKRGYNRKWRAANPERVREYNREWRAANPEYQRERHAANPEYQREWRIANLEKRREYERQWCAANPEKRREQGRRRWAASPDKVRASHRKWCAENPGKLNALYAAKRACKLRQTPPWVMPLYKKQIEALYAAATRLTKLTGEQWDVDHIVPLKPKVNEADVALGYHPPIGLHVPANLRVISQKRNGSRGNRLNYKQLNALLERDPARFDAYIEKQRTAHLPLLEVLERMSLLSLIKSRTVPAQAANTDTDETIPLQLAA